VKQKAKNDLPTWKRPIPIPFVAVLCEYGTFVDTTSFVDAALLRIPPIWHRHPVRVPDQQPRVVVSKDAAEDTNVTEITVVDTLDEVTAVTSNTTSGGHSADVLVPFGMLAAAFGSVVACVTLI